MKNPTPNTPKIVVVAAAFALMCAAESGTCDDVFIGRNTTLHGKQTGLVRAGWLDKTRYNQSNASNPTIRIVRGAVLSEGSVAENASTLDISGGLVNNGVRGVHSSKVNISGGVIKGGVEINNSAVLTMSGGTISGAGVAAFHHGVIFLRGGHIAQRIELYDRTTLHLYGTGWKARIRRQRGVHQMAAQLTDTGTPDQDALRNQFDIHHVSGVLADGTAFDKQINASRTSKIVLHNAPAHKQPASWL